MFPQLFNITSIDVIQAKWSALMRQLKMYNCRLPWERVKRATWCPGFQFDQETFATWTTGKKLLKANWRVIVSGRGPGSHDAGLSNLATFRNARSCTFSKRRAISLCEERSCFIVEPKMELCQASHISPSSSCYNTMWPLTSPSCRSVGRGCGPCSRPLNLA